VALFILAREAHNHADYSGMNGDERRSHVCVQLLRHTTTLVRAQGLTQPAGSKRVLEKYQSSVKPLSGDSRLAWILATC